MKDWNDPYYVTLDAAERLSLHKRGHLLMMVHSGIIGHAYTSGSRNIHSLVVSLRDILIEERNENRRGPNSVCKILTSLTPYVYTDSTPEQAAAATKNRDGLMAKLRTRAQSMYRLENHG